ncbi:hypothetical protein JTE90_018202 [Oedothorax gibbosus]|uniref:Phlebovirus glycoprotein G2 fusion domain-containing protein n=1 Tax=Oedothorax gibbosus TaxID=931172 RepID=A0AAV6U9M9_9ARAC|nr:hypothetical protein JTE90_018202 [Oedothorax gibbosus]
MRALYTMENSFKRNVTEECDCRGAMCKGDSDFCGLFPCSMNPTKCYCNLTHEEATILHFTETQTLTNPAQITFDICLFDKRQVHQKRRLLEHEEARFSSHNLTIKFIDPVLHVPEPGRVILRTEEYEHFLSITNELQVTLPFELLAYKTELTLIYINQKGFAVSGVIQIAGKSACQLTQCIFCSEGLRTIKFWPAPVQYAAYGLIMGSIVLILCSNNPQIDDQYPQINMHPLVLSVSSCQVNRTALSTFGILFRNTDTTHRSHSA